MDTRTGRIESIYTEEDERDALERGLVPLTPKQLEKAAPMSHKQRIAYAKSADFRTDREELATLHHSMHGGKTRSQRKRERRNRGRNR
jgi:hypothetical protein